MLFAERKVESTGEKNLRKFPPLPFGSEIVEKLIYLFFDNVRFGDEGLQ
jgi:hypothetical protein